MLGLHFTPSLHAVQSSFCILHSVCILSLVRSLQSAVRKLRFTLTVKPDIIGITETKLNEFSTSNVDIESYNFFHKDSPSNAGGAVLYVSNNLKTFPIPDIKINMNGIESCWCQVNTSRNKKPIIIVGWTS